VSDEKLWDESPTSRHLKPYLGFQNLGCDTKNLGCHFDTQKRLEKTLGYAITNTCNDE